MVFAMSSNDPRQDQYTVDFESVPEASATVEITGNSSPSSNTISDAKSTNSAFPSISGYQILSEIAKGGMGCVYAGREMALDREVAIKTLLPGANADRFVTESKITAKLPHPCIPPVYALGSFGNGTPYLAMKFIRGRTLAAELTERTDIEKNLAYFIHIFEQIAQAVGFAHSRGIIHRDLKPLNVMLGEFGEVQVMDWGLAKESGDVLHTELLQQTQNDSNDPALTLAGAIMGTPGYMAPEQARGEMVDARADVFSLGAILISILTGRPAFAGSTLRESLIMAAKAKLDDAYVRLEECGLDSELVLLAKQCLSPNPEERPRDGQAVANEVAAYRARVDSRLREAEMEKAAASVRERESAKRRRQWFIAAGTITLCLAVGLAASLWQMQRAIAAERLANLRADETRLERDAKEAARQAEQARAEGERQAKEEAQRNLDYARKGNSILGSVFTALDPSAKYETIGDLRSALKNNLNNATSLLNSNAIGNPLEIADLQNTLGMSLLGLGEGEDAISILKQAFETKRALLGPENPSTLGSMGNLAEGYRIAGKLKEAEKLNEETLQILKKALGPTHRDTLTAMNNLAATYYSAGDLERAMSLYEETLQLRKEHLEPDHADTLATVSNLAAAYYKMGQVEKAIRYFEETLEIVKRKQGGDHVDTLTMMNNLAATYFAAGRQEDSIKLFQESLKARQAKLGVEHPDTLSTMRNLGIVYVKAKEGEKASKISGEYLDIQRKLFPANDPRFANVLAVVATDLLLCEEYQKAEEVLRECLAIRQATEGEQWTTFNTQSQLGAALLGQKKFEEAKPYLIDGYEGMMAREKEIPANATVRLIQALDRLIEYFSATNDSVSADKFREIKNKSVKKEQEN
ncbi:MAG: hypothetical protein RLY14_2460 [Planctomycetota bacterium]|jgi:serine/threonine protein kinase